LKAALVLGKRIQRIAHQSDCRLMQIDDLDSGHHPQ
jgi:hypothetical protein